MCFSVDEGWFGFSVTLRSPFREAQVTLVVKNLPVHTGDTRLSGSAPEWEDPLEEGMATHPSILAWRISWTEELGGLQSMGSQRVRHD